MTMEDTLKLVSNKLHNSRIDIGRILDENKDIDYRDDISALKHAHRLIEQTIYIIENIINGDDKNGTK